MPNGQVGCRGNLMEEHQDTLRLSSFFTLNHSESHFSLKGGPPSVKTKFWRFDHQILQQAVKQQGGVEGAGGIFELLG